MEKYYFRIQVIIVIIFDYLTIQFEFTDQQCNICFWIICNILQDQGENLEDGEGKNPACFPDTKERTLTETSFFFFYLSSLKIDEKDQEKLCLIRSKCSLW